MVIAFILLVALVIIVILWLINHHKSKKAIRELRKKLKQEQQYKVFLTDRVKLLSSKNAILSKYEHIIDVEKEAKEILAAAEKNSQGIVETAEQQVKTAHEKKAEIENNILKATLNLKEVEKAAKAMKNIIEGYGDQYLIPTYSLLDDLAEEFGYTQAGENLKLTRESIRSMIKNRTAATCDYVEESRRMIAVDFVLDAFNGKVDTILSKIKKDNYGTLEQQIKDAYQIVNNNGIAFRNAKITSEYLSKRLEELKWAVIAQELKWQEQEEQRRIKEKIRAEEKARREYEKVMREAQKEEETLKKLIEKAQKEVAQATEEQKAQYEEKLEALGEKLKVAEEKNQRAISMAQQTKSGSVYIISNIGSFGENVYKIGMTRRLEPMDRIKELGDASVPFDFDVHTMIYSDDAPGLERELHKRFLRLQMNKVNPRKEFFRVSISEIKTEVDKLDIQAKWTMVAGAKQYRESLTIEEAIATDVQKQIEWEQYQLQLDTAMAEADEEQQEA